MCDHIKNELVDTPDLYRIKAMGACSDSVSSKDLYDVLFKAHEI